MAERGKARFSRAETDSVKEIALICMFVHHFFTFPSWWGGVIEYPTIAALAPVFQAPFRICVPVFCFLTGYFYSIGQNRSWRHVLRKASDFLLSYWAAFALLAVAAVVSVGWPYTPLAVIQEAFALKRPTMLFCWYVMFYLPALLLLPLVPRLCTGKSGIDVGIWVLLVPLLMLRIRGHVHSDAAWECMGYLMEWFPCMCFGYLWGRYDWFASAQTWLQTRKSSVAGQAAGLAADLALAAAAAMGRWILPALTVTVPGMPWSGTAPSTVSVSLDLLYAPLFVFSLVGVLRFLPGVLQKVLGSIGKHSMMMWFLSCIFFGNAAEVFKPILYAPRNPVLVLVWGLLLCWAGSVLLDGAVAPIRRGKNRLLFREQEKKSPLSRIETA